MIENNHPRAIYDFMISHFENTDLYKGKKK